MLVRADGVSYCNADLTAIFLPIPARLTNFPCHRHASSSSDDILLFSIQTPLTDFVQSPLCFQLCVWCACILYYMSKIQDKKTSVLNVCVCFEAKSKDAAYCTNSSSTREGNYIQIQYDRGRKKERQKVICWRNLISSWCSAHHRWAEAL